MADTGGAIVGLGVTGQSRMQVRGKNLVVSLPNLFGRTEWSIPLRDIGITSQRFTVRSEDVLFASDPQVPFLPGGKNLRDANLTLVFRHPQKVPPLKRTAVVTNPTSLTYSGTRSEQGEFLDGFQTRVRDPKGIIRAFEKAGVSQIGDPVHFLARNRTAAPDTGAAAEVARLRTASSRRMMLTSIIGMIVEVAIVVGSMVGSGTIGIAALSALVVVAAVVVGLIIRESNATRRKIAEITRRVGVVAPPGSGGSQLPS